MYQKTGDELFIAHGDHNGSTAAPLVSYSERRAEKRAAVAAAQEAGPQSAHPQSDVSETCADHKEKVMATDTPATPEAGFVPEQRELEINKLFRTVMKHEGSDLHLKVGLPPLMRIGGNLRQLQMEPLTEETIEMLTRQLLTGRLRSILDETGGVDFAHPVGDDEGRFRVNVYRQRGKLSLAARRQ